MQIFQKSYTLVDILDLIFLFEKPIFLKGKWILPCQFSCEVVHFANEFVVCTRDTDFRGEPHIRVE